MKPKIIKLVKANPNGSVIKHLDKLMTVAKTGHLVDIAYAGVYRDRSVIEGFTAIQEPLRLLGELVLLQRSLEQSIRDNKNS